MSTEKLQASEPKQLTLYQQVRIRLIERKITLRQLTKQLKLNYDYTFQVLNGNRNSETIVNAVKTELNITD